MLWPERFVCLLHFLLTQRIGRIATKRLFSAGSILFQSSRLLRVKATAMAIVFYDFIFLGSGFC
jgi:hypothetical protein